MCKKRAGTILVVNREKTHYLAVSLKKNKKQFTMPGGTINNNESFKRGAIRELKEETGIIVNQNDLQELYTCDNLEGHGHKWITKTFYAKSWRGYIHTNEEGIVKWLPLKYFVENAHPKWKSHETVVYKNYMRFFGNN